MKNLSKILMVFTLVATLIYSCTESNKLDESSKLIYKKDISLAEQDYEHYRSINSIEKISKNNSDLKTVIDKANISIDTSTDILRYTFENNLTAYKISDVYIYSNNDNVLAVKTTEIVDSKSKNKILSLSNPYNDEVYYKMELNTINSYIVNFEKINHFPLEQLGFDKNSDNVLNKAYQKEVECDDLGWSDCMDCTVSECGSRWWCVAALVVAGPEVLIGMGVSCVFDQ